MNIEEGSRRMRAAGCVVALIGFGVVLLIVCFSIINELYGPHNGNINWAMIMLHEVMFLGAWMIVPGVALWIAGWIVKGFSQNDKL